jgi:cysteine desulfurase
MTIYLDNAASTPLDPAVLECIHPWLSASGANASSAHAPGRAAAAAVATAREEVALALGMQPSSVVFTATATEACNLAITGLVRPRLRRGDRVHLVAPAHEHAAVLDPLRRMEREGARLTLVAPPSSGVIEAAHLEGHLRKDTLLVACMQVNNEIGTLNDIPSVEHLCKRHGARLLVDATAALGRVDQMPQQADLVVASSHKIHGPAGAGVLGIRTGARSMGLQPLVEGGGHESGLRSGSLNVPAIVGFGAACQLFRQDLRVEQDRQRALRDRLECGLLSLFPGSIVHGDMDARAAHISMVTLATGQPDGITTLVPQVACSTGSACTSMQPGPSHVLEAIGVQAAQGAGAIRFSLGRQTCKADIDAALEAFTKVSRR